MGLFGKHKKNIPSLDTGRIDGVAADNENKLRMLLTDAIPWDNSLPEHDHLTQLQEKINNYIMFYESKQYKEIYPDLKPDGAVIEIHFIGAVSENCEKFLHAVNSQTAGSGIVIEYQTVQN